MSTTTQEEKALTIDEMRKKKAETETAIAELLTAFSQAVGIQVTDLRYQAYDITGIGERRTTTRCRIDIEVAL